MEKNENQKSVCVFTDVSYMENTSKELASALQSMQELYQEWQALNIGDVVDLNELLTNPAKVYKAVIDKIIVIPEGGSFPVNKEKYLSGLNLPDPAKVYAIAKEIINKSFCRIPDLFLVTPDKRVILNEGLKDYYLNLQNIVISGSEKIQLAKDLTKFVELFNSLDQRLKGELLIPSVHATNYFLQKFSFTQTSYPAGRYSLGLIPNVLKRWLSL